MDHRSLQCFVALAEELHFGRAAKRAHISQSGLSGQISRLEKRMGGKLFMRSTRRVALTAAGAEFFPHAQRALQALELGIRSFRACQGPAGGHLVIAVTNICAEWGAYDLISSFSSRFPHISVETRELTSNLQEEALVRGTIDVGFIHPPVMDRIKHQDLARDEFGVAFLDSHPLAERSELHLLDLANHALIIFPRENGPHLFDRIQSAFEQAGVQPRFSEFATPLTMSLRAAAAGRGVALVCRSFAQGLSDSLVYRSVVGLDVSLAIAVGWHAECQNEAVAAFRTHCQAAYD